MASSTDQGITVTEVNIYPVKSCRSLPMQSATVDELGFAGDRRLMVVDGNGRFLSQRKVSAMAKITVELEDDGKVVCLSAPGHDTLRVKIVRRPYPPQNVLREVVVWQSSLHGVDQGDEAAQWLQRVLGTSSTFNRLVALPDPDVESSAPRPVKFPAGMPTLPGRNVAFNDAGPLLLISEESLADLNSRLVERTGAPVPMNRFRPNIVVRGCTEAFQEDSWLLVEIGGVSFMAYEKAERCKMTGINQQTGEHDKLGPLEILREYRAPRGPGHAEFGQMLVPLTRGQVAIGDKVNILDLKLEYKQQKS